MRICKDGATAGTTTTAQKSACCTAKAHCDSLTCAANTVAITNAATTDCGTNAASCTQGSCCTADTTKCAHTSVTCDTGFYKDSTKDQTSIWASKMFIMFLGVYEKFFLKWSVVFAWRRSYSNLSNVVDKFIVIQICTTFFRSGAQFQILDEHMT